MTGNETRNSLSTQELMALTDEELTQVNIRTHTPSTVRRAEIEAKVRLAIIRAKAKAGLL